MPHLKGAPMRIAANIGACQGYGNCAALDPHHFDVDDDGLVIVLRDSVLDGELETAAAAVRSCPVAVLELLEDGN
jgi:ferredoxin